MNGKPRQAFNSESLANVVNKGQYRIGTRNRSKKSSRVLSQAYVVPRALLNSDKPGGNLYIKTDRFVEAGPGPVFSLLYI